MSFLRDIIQHSTRTISVRAEKSLQMDAWKSRQWSVEGKASHRQAAKTLSLQMETERFHGSRASPQTHQPSRAIPFPTGGHTHFSPRSEHLITCSSRRHRIIWSWDSNTSPRGTLAQHCEARLYKLLSNLYTLN